MALYPSNQAQHPDVDPWKLQAELMAAAPGQHLPPMPAITLSTFTYLALMIEEIAETCEAVHDAVPHSDNDTSVGMYGVAVNLVAIRKTLKLLSVGLRNEIAKHPHLRHVAMHLTAKNAKDVADGFTDVVVTACGGAIATGLPGGPLYQQVVGSNISKKQADGTIHVDGSGKWIKGPNYVEPDLLSVLRAAGAL